jgi:hypothetical protein
LDKAGEIVEQLAGVEDYELAAATWLAARSSDGRKTASCCGSFARVVEDSHKPRLVK